MPQEPEEGQAVKASDIVCHSPYRRARQGLHGPCYSQDRLRRHLDSVASIGWKPGVALESKARLSACCSELRTDVPCTRCGADVLYYGRLQHRLAIMPQCRHMRIVLKMPHYLAGWCMTDRNQWRRVAQLCIVSHDLH